MRFVYAVIILCISASVQAAPVTITFDDIAVGDYGPSFVTPQGYQISGTGFGPLAVQESSNGGNSLQVNGPDWFPFVSISHASNQVFSLQQMDVLFIDPEVCNSSPDCIATAYSRDVFIQGEDEFGAVITDMTVLYSEGLGWRTVSFDGAWSGISTIRMSGSLYSSVETQSGGYDNIVVSAVPIPAAAWLFGSALAGLMGLRRIRAT